MRDVGRGLTRFIVVGLAALVLGVPMWAAAAGSPAAEVGDLRREIERLKEENEANRERMETLGERLEQVESQGEEDRKALEAKIVEGPSSSVLRGALGRYWGENRFLMTGYGFGSYAWNDNANENTFSAALVPIFLYRLNDWILFEGEVEFELENGETEVGLEYAVADVFVTDYLTISAGKFLLPFGEFAERLHPAWINKMVSVPAPYQGPNRIVPFTDIGVQFRGGVDLGVAGLLDYTVYVTNGPSFDLGEGGAGDGGADDRSFPGGARLTNNFEDSNRGKGYGARVGLMPFPTAGEMGYLRVGASTYNGKANDDANSWYYAWGLDATYRYDMLEFRGEFLSGRLDLPGPRDDNRDGWYGQVAYALSRLAPAPLDRVELIARYSGANRRGDDDLRKPRQVAFGVDYWLTPSVVFKLEYDRDLPNGADNNNQILTQLAVGF